MSDSSLSSLIRWLLIKNGLTEDDANSVIEILRSERLDVGAEKVNDPEIRSSLSQRIARQITRLQLGEDASSQAFEDRYQHNYQLVLIVFSQILIGIPIQVMLAKMTSDPQLVVMINNENRQYAEYCWEIGNIYDQQGALDRAIEEYGQAIKFYPGYTQAYYNRGRAHLKKGENDLAIADLGEAIRLARNDKSFNDNKSFTASAFYSRGIAYACKGDNDQAIRDYTDAITLKPDFAEALRGRGHAHLDRGQARGKGELAIVDFDAAIKDLDEVIIRLNVGEFGDFYNRGLAYACKGDNDQAITDYKAAITLKPDFAEAFHGLGLAYHNKRKYHRTIKKFDRAIEINPRYARAFYNRAVAYWELKDYVRATKDVNKAIKLDPNLAKAFVLRSLARGMVGDIKGYNDDARRADELRKLGGKSGG
jgi:tetratricopeptide (TPR) repeat protein